MTFEEFRATAVEVDDLSKALPAEGSDLYGGRVYLGTLWIGDAATWPAENRERVGGGRWWLVIGRDEVMSDELDPLERRLFEYARREGFA